MCDGVNRYRVSILAFDDTVLLGRAIKDLVGNGLESAQLCLAGLPEILNTLQVPDDLDHQAKNAFSALLATPDLPLRLDGSANLVARGGPKTNALLKPLDQAIGTFDWMQEQRQRELARHAAKGAVILLVIADTAEQLSVSAGFLLRHGRHNLQTHVFSRPITR